MAGRYKNVKRTTLDGIKFDSLAEASRYSQLLIMQRAGAISELELQVKFPITIGGVSVIYDSGRHMTYIADFVYIEDGKCIVEDVKGHITDVYKIKKALMKAMGFHIRESK